MTNSARDLIMGNSAPAMSFTYPGDGVTGKVITEPKAVQQTVYDPRNPASKEPAFWPSGDPKMQVIFQIQTTFRNWEGVRNPDRTQTDDGRRTIYLKGKHMERATADAVRAVGAEWIEVGGTVWYRYTGDDMNSLAGVKPKLFEVRYQAPVVQPPAHFNQNQGYEPQGAQGYQGGGYGGYAPPQGAQAPRQDPRPPQPAQPNWQQPGWTADQAYTPVAPPHHGTPDTMPDWGRPSSAPPAPAPSSAPPALSTLDLIRNGQQSDSNQFGSVEPAF